MTRGLLGRLYGPGEIIVRQGDVGDCMYVIQDGEVEVVIDDGTRETRVDVLQAGNMFGEMAIIQRQTRSATVRTLGDARILTIDRKTFLRRVQEDPSLAFSVLRVMCERVRKLDAEVVALKATLSEPRAADAESRAPKPTEGGQ